MGMREREGGQSGKYRYALKTVKYKTMRYKKVITAEVGGKQERRLGFGASEANATIFLELCP